MECGLRGHVGRTTAHLTSPPPPPPTPEARHCAFLYTHTMRVHYLCCNLGRKGNVYTASSRDSHVPNVQLKCGQDSRSPCPQGGCFNVIEHDTSGRLHTHTNTHECASTNWHKCSIFICTFFKCFSLKVHALHGQSLKSYAGDRVEKEKSLLEG